MLSSSICLSYIYSKELKRHLVFRDYLRCHLDGVKIYSEIKEKGAQLYPNDIEKYIEYKTPIIEELYKQCGLL